MNIIEYYRNIAIINYHVDPIIFIVLIIISIPFYYYGLFVMGKIIYRLKTKHKLIGKEILKHKEFIRALVINQVAWIAPYIYVLFWGENLPLWFWVLIFAYIILAAYLFYKKIFVKVK